MPKKKTKKQEQEEKRDRMIDEISEYMSIHYPIEDDLHELKTRVEKMTTKELEEFSKELDALWVLEQVVIDKHMNK